MNTIQYPPRASVALGFLRSRNNDVEIYVEDTACKFVWENLIKIANTKKYKIKNINRMGGKENVINACICDQTDKKRKRIYIVDGDLDRITGKRYKKLKFFYKIKSYCIENILVRKEQVIELSKIYCSDHELETIERKIDYESFEYNIKKLQSLFLIFGIIQRKNIGIANVSMGLKDFISHNNKHIFINEEKVFKKNLIISRNIVKIIGYEKYYIEMKRMKRMKSQVNHMKIVSGKDYIIPFLALYIKGRIKYKDENNILKKHLSLHCDFSNDKGLKNAISSL